MSSKPQNVKIRYTTALLGNSAVGKTSIKRSYLGMDFIDNYRMTLGSDVSFKTFNKYALKIWDLGGQQGFLANLNDYFHDIHSAIVVFDITNKESFTKIRDWVNFVNMKASRQVPIVLVGNKADLRGLEEDEVTHREATHLSQELSQESLFEVPYIEASAKTGLNVDYVFAYLISIMENRTQS